MLIDLHTHTRPLSWDSFLHPDDLIELSRERGLDGICLTEHDFFWDTEDVIELGKKHNYPVFPGIEINTEDGHMLVFGLTKYIYGMHRVSELAQHVESAGGVMIAAHPYRRQMPWNAKNEQEWRDALERASRLPAYKHCDALERINGRGTEKENLFSAQLCDLMEMPGTGGTDSHQRSDIGKCATLFERDVRTLEDLISELKAGRFRAVAREAPVAT
jgi:predicted metal-dependent phosphoesterase TrpH